MLYKRTFCRSSLEYVTVCCWFSDSAITVPASEHFDNIVVYSVV